MAYELLSDRNMSEGMAVPLVYINDILGGLPMKFLLFSIWGVFTFGLYFIQKRSSGTADFPQCITIGSFVTAIFTIIMMVTADGLVDVYTGTIVFGILVVSVIWLFLSRED